MTNTAVPIRSTEEVARTIGINVQTILKEQGRNLDWLAGELDISSHTILKAFTERVETWLLFDLSFYLEVAPDRLIGADR